MYGVLIQTATIDEAPPYVDPNGVRQLLGPGTRSHVYFTLYGARAASERVVVSGQDGLVSYGARGVVGVAEPVAPSDQPLLARGPFTAGLEIMIRLDGLTPPLDIGQVERVVIGHTPDEAGAAWYLKRVVVIDDKLQPTVFDVNRWLVAPNAEVTLSPSGPLDRPVDPPPPDLPIDPAPTHRITVRPKDAVRFVFSHAVDRSTFIAQPGSPDQRRTVSIRYMDTLEGANLTPEAPATRGAQDWSESFAGRITGYGQYLWSDERTLIIGPPEGGWPVGRFVRFALDQSLRDTTSRRLALSKAYVLVAQVIAPPSVVVSITAPAHTSFWPWESGDDPFGRPEDFVVDLEGTVSWQASDGQIDSLIISATNTRDDAAKTITATIVAGAQSHDDLAPTGGSRWIPAEGEARWAIRLPLQDQGYPHPGAQAVAERRYKWLVTATAVLADGRQVRSDDVRAIYHEVFKPHVSRVEVEQPGGIVIYASDESLSPPPTLNEQPKSFLVTLRGDFDWGTLADSTYSISQADNFAVMQFAELFNVVSVQGFDEVPQGEELAVLSMINALPPPEQRLATYQIAFTVRTRAGSAVRGEITYQVDTTPFEVIETSSEDMSRAGAQPADGPLPSEAGPAPAQPAPPLTMEAVLPAQPAPPLTMEAVLPAEPAPLTQDKDSAADAG